MRFHAKDWERLHVELERAFDDLKTPGEPKRVYACATADLPPASDYPGCIVRDTTTNTFKYSDGSSWS